MSAMPTTQDEPKAATDAKDEELSKGTMTFWEHLDELRSRMFKAILAVVAGGIGAWWYKKELLQLAMYPLQAGWTGDQKPVIHFPTPAAMFIAYIMLAVLGGLVLALPILFYQLWAFISPGLYKKEKRLVGPFVFVSTVLFAGGVYFGWKIALPTALEYLLSYREEFPGFIVEDTIMIGDYMSFVTRLLLAFGASFELPVLVFFLAAAGVVNHKQLLKFSRYFIVLSFFISAIITPPDALSQLLLAIPLIELYFISVGLAWMVNRGKAT